MGEFIGQVIARWLPNDPRRMELVSTIEFIDPTGKKWLAQSGEIIDGASIPRLFWVWGSPFVGLYRRASVIHDIYCQYKTRPAAEVHKAFYDMCLADGVGKIKAKLMYNAIKLGGPKW